MVGGPRTSMLYSPSAKFRKTHRRKNVIFRPNGSPSNGHISGPPGHSELIFFPRPFEQPGGVVAESGPDEPQARRKPCRQMTRVSKIPNLNPLPNCEIGSVFRNSKCYMDRFSMPFTKNAIEIGFRENSFLAIFDQISGFRPRKKYWLYNGVWPNLPFTNVPSVL